MTEQTPWPADAPPAGTTEQAGATTAPTAPPPSEAPAPTAPTPPAGADAPAAAASPEVPEEAGADGAAAAPATAAAAPPSHNRGQLVTYSYDDVYTGEVAHQHGIVVGVLEDGSCEVAWLSAGVSGPIPADQLEG